MVRNDVKRCVDFTDLRTIQAERRSGRVEKVRRRKTLESQSISSVHCSTICQAHLFEEHRLASSIARMNETNAIFCCSFFFFSNFARLATFPKFTRRFFHCRYMYSIFEPILSIDSINSHNNHTANNISIRRVCAQKNICVNSITDDIPYIGRLLGRNARNSFSACALARRYIVVASGERDPVW